MPPTKIVEVFVAWQVIADDVMGFPSPKKREAGTDLHLHGVIQDKEVAGGDVSDFISVIDVLSSSWENGLYREKEQSEHWLGVISSEIGKTNNGC